MMWKQNSRREMKLIASKQYFYLSYDKYLYLIIAYSKNEKF